MKSTDFRHKDYYVNIRKAVTAGYFMQVINAVVVACWRCLLEMLVGGRDAGAHVLLSSTHNTACDIAAHTHILTLALRVATC